VLVGHTLQLSPFSPEKPALHSHAALLILFGKEFALVGHDTQGEDPFTDLYVLAMHMEHVTPPFGPDHPALQTQAYTEVLADGECELALHTLHASDPGVAL